MKLFIRQLYLILRLKILKICFTLFRLYIVNSSSRVHNAGGDPPPPLPILPTQHPLWLLHYFVGCKHQGRNWGHLLCFTLRPSLSNKRRNTFDTWARQIIILSFLLWIPAPPLKTQLRPWQTHTHTYTIYIHTHTQLIPRRQIGLTYHIVPKIAPFFVSHTYQSWLHIHLLQL